MKTSVAALVDGSLPPELPTVLVPARSAVRSAPSHPASVHPASADGSAEVRTREAVVQLLLAGGPLTAAALAEQIGLSPAAIRRHLDQLLAEGAIVSREASTLGPRGRGRPARTYLLTEVGRTRLPHAYDSLAVQALEFLADSAGPDAVTAFARKRAENLLDGVRDELSAAVDVPAKAQVLAEALTGAGFSASVEQVGIGEQLCQHHCPVAHVAARFPQLCEEEMVVITEALGTYAQRLATIANGDSFCTTFIPAAHLKLRPEDRPEDRTDKPELLTSGSSL